MKVTKTAEHGIGITSASRVSVIDSDGHYTGADVETILAELATRTAYATIPFFIDGGGVPITTGLKVWVGPIDFAGEIEAGTLLADQEGDVEVDVLTTIVADWDPPTVPTSAESITAAAPLVLSSASVSQDTTLTGWTTAFAVGTIFAFEVVSASTITRLEGALKVRKT